MSEQLFGITSPPKLSLVAQFDDLCRFSNYVMSANEELVVLKDMIGIDENNRKEWLSTKEQLFKVKRENKKLKSTLTQTKRDLSQANRKKEYFKSLNLELGKRLNSIKRLIEDKLSVCQCRTTLEQLSGYFDDKLIMGEMDSDSDQFYSSVDDESLWEETNEESDDLMIELQTLFNDIDLIQ